MNASKEPWGNTVLVEFEDGIAWVYFNRPEKKNCMNPTLNREMRETIHALEHDERCKVIVLSGKGEAWSAGMDLKEYFRETDGFSSTKKLQVRRDAANWQQVSLRNCLKPTIAMVNGWLFGGAFTPLTSCDLAFADEEAKFGLSEINWGILPGGNVTKAVHDFMNHRDGMYYILTGDTFTGKQAAEMKLVNEALPTDKLRARVIEVAKSIMAKDLTTVVAAKEVFRRIKHMDYETSNDYIYAKLNEAIFMGGSEFRRGAMKAFLDDKTLRPGLETFDSEAK